MNKIILITSLFVFSISSVIAQDISELFEKLDKSVVVIKVVGSKTNGEGKANDKVSYGSMGSGVLIDKEGTILTAAHIVNDGDEILVEFYDGQTLMAKVEGASIIADIAKIKVVGRIKNPHPATMGDSDSTKIGEKIMIIGSPMGLDHSLSVGYISRKEKHKSKTSNLNRVEFFQTDASINTGNSGGPMFNMEGELIGIVSSIVSRSGGFEGIGFAATINIVKTILIDHRNNWLGLDARILYGPLAVALNVPQDGGVLVMNVTKSSPSYYMGLKGGNIVAKIGEEEVVIGGDIILEVNGKILDSPENILKAVDHINTLKPGDKYVFKVLRMGEVKEFTWKVK